MSESELYTVYRRGVPSIDELARWYKAGFTHTVPIVSMHSWHDPKTYIVYATAGMAAASTTVPVAYLISYYARATSGRRIWALEVHPSTRQQGIGSQLLDLCVRDAAAEHSQHVYTEVPNSLEKARTLRRLLKLRGFTSIKTIISNKTCYSLLL